MNENYRNWVNENCDPEDAEEATDCFDFEQESRDELSKKSCLKCFGTGKVTGPIEEGAHPAWDEIDCPLCAIPL